MTAIPQVPTPRAAPDDRAEAARQLEAFFLRRLLAEARPQSADPLVGGGFAGETFKEMLDEQLADRMSDAGGFGLAAMIGEQLGADPAAVKGPRVGATTSIEALERRLQRPPAPELRAAIDPAAELGPAAVSDDGFLVPVSGRRSSGYGVRKDPINGTTSLHPGLDLAAATGTQVSAAAGGVVVHAGPAGTYGNLIKIRHDNGLETRYAHLSKVGVQVGDRVEQGAPIGAVGSTGHSTGPHLHFEVRDHGKPLDPVEFLPPVRSGLKSGPTRSTR